MALQAVATRAILGAVTAKKNYPVEHGFLTLQPWVVSRAQILECLHLCH